MSATKKNQIIRRGTRLPKLQRRDIDISELLSALADFISSKIKGFFSAIGLKIKRKTTGWRFPWVRVALLGILAYVLLTRDMNFNLSLQAPIKAAHSSIIADNDYKAMPVVHQEVTPSAVESEAAKRRALQDENHLAYIKRFEDVAVGEMTKYGIPASIKMAQALLESGAGKSKLSNKNNNHFGIKCKKEWKGQSYYHNDDDYDSNGKLIKSCFRSYSTILDSYIDHSNFLKGRSHYSPLFTLDKKDYKAWAHGLKKYGYATDPAYADKLIKSIEKNNLYIFDYWEDPRKLLEDKVKNEQTVMKPTRTILNTEYNPKFFKK